MDAIIRSCVVFGVKTIIMTERHAPKECGVMAKTASGCLEHISFVIVKNLSRTIKDLQDQHFWTVGLCRGCPKCGCRCFV